MNINLTPFQRNNLLQFLNRVTLTGYDEANALLELVNLIQNAEEINPQKTQIAEKSESKSEEATEKESPAKQHR